jgi:hypothetical protein
MFKYQKENFTEKKISDLLFSNYILINNVKSQFEKFKILAISSLKQVLYFKLNILQHTTLKLNFQN